MKVIGGNDGVYEFVFTDDQFETDTIQVKHVPEESSYPSFDNIGRIKSVLLTFERLEDQRKVFITRFNVPEEIWYVNKAGNKEQLV